ncbi:MAG: adenosine deaminase [Candidatus Thorarchaeota archaeon]
MDISEAIRLLPKVEQHVHILGSIRPATLMRALDESGIESEFSSLEELEKQFIFRDFQHFLSVYLQAIQAVRREKYFETMVFELLETSKQCNVKYVEMSFSAADHIEMGLDFERMMKAIEKGIERGKKAFGVISDIRIDLVRGFGLENAMGVLDLIEERPEGIVSIDLGGPEKEYPPDIYIDAYRRAKEMGLHLVAHAGEAVGPESIWSALRNLGVERIGHGVSAIRDRVLMENLRDRGITIETCPVSNIRTKVVESMENHPIRAFFDAGISISVNSDDPSFFNTDMNNEFLQLSSVLGFSLDDLFRISLDTIDTSFLDPKVKERLNKQSRNEYEHITQSLD